jgi:hypothetical protein
MLQARTEGDPFDSNSLRRSHHRGEEYFVEKVKKILDKTGIVPFIIVVTWLVALALKIEEKV